MKGLFIAGDWGTTHLRLFLCSNDAVLDTRAGQGIRALTRTPAEEFDALTAEWRRDHRIERAVLGGMVGSRNGWVEAGYVRCPASIENLRTQFTRFVHGGASVAIVPGLSFDDGENADVMRGEETQLFGALSLHSNLLRGRHVFALPGTHTKWVAVEDGRVVEFHTALTGELFALLRTHSTLLATGAAAPAELEESAFTEGLTRQQTDASLIHALFQVRSRQLVRGATASQASGLLSGLVIGADVSGAIRMMKPKSVTLICAPALAQRYAQALRVHEIETKSLDGDECVLAGLRALAA